MKTKSKPKKLNLLKLEPHPLGAIFPPMSDAEYTSLQKGMKDNGFDPQHPIIIHENQILEGNHRYTAAKSLKGKVTAVFKNFEDLKFDGTPIEYVMQENLRRRNLTPSQLAMIGAELVEQMEAAEKAASTPANLQSGEKVTKAAKITKVSPRSVATARSVKKKNPKAAAEVRKGKKSLNKAAKETEEKVSAAQAKTEEYDKAVDRIDKVLGAGFTLATAEKNTTFKSKDILQLSNLDKSEMKRVKPFLDSGWKLKDALSYKSVEPSMKHTLAQARDFAISKGGTATLEIGGWRFAIERINVKA